MKAIRIDAWQTMASYRIPASFIIKESYPLPPYSTVIGMIHAACGFQEYVPMDVSVQGKGYSSISDLYTKYDFNPSIAYEAGRHQIEIPCEGRSCGVTRGAGRVELVVDAELVFHVKTLHEERLEEIVKGLLNPVNYPSLGRWEDLIRLDSVRIVEVEETILSNTFFLPYNAYVPLRTEAEYEKDAFWHGTIYTLNKDYTIDLKTNFRRWNRVRARYASQTSFVTEDKCLWMDSEGTPVFFA